MNQIKEVIDVKKASCREMYMPDLMELLHSDFRKYVCWGARNFLVDKKQPTMFRMLVSGNLHKGYVYIFLNGMDLFDVYLTTTQGTIKDRTDEMGLYFDQLVDWIDDKIERLPNYVY